MKKERIVIALGGNALQTDSNDCSALSQLEIARKTAKPLVDLIEEGHEVIIAHGNGPQVGRIVSVYEKTQDGMPFPECGAMSQGYIGYHLQQSINDEMQNRGINKSVASVVTQVLVDKKDKSFNNPTKPIGAFYSEEEAEILKKENGFTMMEDAGRGWRRVVPSPEPIDIIESPIVKTLVEAGHVVITVGGGGIPVVRKDNGNLEGVAAVIDKDFAAEKISETLDADYLIILTAVEKVSINFNKPNQQNLSEINLKDAYRYIEEGHFAPGSMLPKVKAAIKFVESKPGRKVLITSLEKVKEGIEGKTGTVLVDK